MAECVSAGGSCVLHMWADLGTIEPLCGCVPGQRGSNDTADSWTRNVKSAEASHIKIASMPCQQALTADTRCLTAAKLTELLSGGWRCWGKGKPAHRLQQQDNSSARVEEEERRESYYPAGASLSPLSAPHTRVRKQVELNVSTHSPHTEAALTQFPTQTPHPSGFAVDSRTSSCCAELFPADTLH